MHSTVIALNHKGEEKIVRQENAVLEDLEACGAYPDYVDEIYKANSGDNKNLQSILELVKNLLRDKIQKNNDGNFTISAEAIKMILSENYAEFKEIANSISEEDFCYGYKLYRLKQAMGFTDSIYVYESHGVLKTWTEFLRDLYYKSLNTDAGIKEFTFEIIQAFDYHS